MNAKELIQKIQDATNNNPNTQVRFRAMFEYGVNTSSDDCRTESTVGFASCEIKQTHPSLLDITLT